MTGLGRHTLSPVRLSGLGWEYRAKVCDLFYAVVGNWSPKVGVHEGVKPQKALPKIPQCSVQSDKTIMPQFEVSEASEPSDPNKNSVVFKEAQ